MLLVYPCFYSGDNAQWKFTPVYNLLTPSEKKSPFFFNFKDHCLDTRKKAMDGILQDRESVNGCVFIAMLRFKKEKWEQTTHLPYNSILPRYVRHVRQINN